VGRPRLSRRRNVTICVCDNVWITCDLRQLIVGMSSNIVHPTSSHNGHPCSRTNLTSQRPSFTTIRQGNNFSFSSQVPNDTIAGVAGTSEYVLMDIISSSLHQGLTSRVYWGPLSPRCTAINTTRGKQIGLNRIEIQPHRPACVVFFQNQRLSSVRLLKNLQEPIQDQQRQHCVGDCYQLQRVPVPKD